MSELEWNWVYFANMDAPDKQHETAERAGYVKVYAKKKVDVIIAEKDKENAELKAALEDVKATAYVESVDACMRERRLKRALYKACANWAHFAVAFFISYATKERWHNMEFKCLKKAKEYK